jgi:hypothetical protein
MENVFAVKGKDFVRSPYTYILLFTILTVYYLYNSVIESNTKQIDYYKQELTKCNTEIKRRDKILEDIVYNKKLKDATE